MSSDVSDLGVAKSLFKSLLLGFLVSYPARAAQLFCRYFAFLACVCAFYAKRSALLCERRTIDCPHGSASLDGR